MVVLVIIISIIFVLIAIFTNEDSSVNKFPGIKKAYSEFEKLSIHEKNVMEKHINDLVYIVKNNIRYLPLDVFNLEYTSKTINAFVWHYTMSVFLKKFTQEQCFILLTIVLDKLDKESIIKFENFNTRIFRDGFDEMPALIGYFNGFPIENNTIILVYVEKYMERTTGKKVRYMKQKKEKIYKNTEDDKKLQEVLASMIDFSKPGLKKWVKNLAEEIVEAKEDKRKASSINGVKLSQENNLNILERPDKTQEYWKVREQVAVFLQNRFKKYSGFKWIRIEAMSPKFDDMSFGYKNKIFSVLIDIKYNNSDKLIIQEKDRFVRECLSNNLIPCIFPVYDRENLSLLSEDHWNLYDIRTNEIINPLIIATDEKVVMSEYELNNIAVDFVKNYIRKENMKLESYCDIIGIFPQIWFKDKNGEMSWVYVNYSINDRFEEVNQEINKLIKGMPQFNGYVAQISLLSDKQGRPYRGDGFYIKFKGLEKVYSAYRDTGHGYGIEVKIG